MKSVAKIYRHLSHSLVATTLGLTFGWIALGSRPVSAQSIIPTPQGTGTEAVFNNSQWTIQGGALSNDQLNLFHQFQQFGLTEGQIANFLANPRLRNIISTVDGGDPSIINGLLQVTGGNPNLFLINPSGIIFGPNAQLNVPANFSALTADSIQFGHRWLNVGERNNYTNLLGNPTAFRFSSDFAGVIVNAGNLQVNPGAALSLMGNTVINTGQLTASQGQILITAVPGESLVRLALPGYILNLEVEVPLTEGNTPQTWQLPITTLPTLLTQGLTPELLGLAITNGGQVQLANGTPVPNASGTAMVSGGVDVSGSQGGTVAILGDRIGLVGAQIDASGTQGNGGQIRVGGEFQGNGPLPNAQRTHVDADTTINADAGPTGNGGRIIIWADEATGFYGDITARGGQLSGDGGFAEVSGREDLRFGGTADLSSFNGHPGELLLDPTDIVISNDPNTATISQETIQNMPANMSLRLEADRDIIIQNLTDNALRLPGVRQDNNSVPRDVDDIVNCGISIVCLTFRAGRNFEMNGTNYIIAPGRDVFIIAGSSIQVGTVSSGDAPLNGRGGSIILDASENIVVDGVLSSRAGSGSLGGDSGVILLRSTFGDIDVNGLPNPGNPIFNSFGSLDSGASTGNAGDITIQTGGGISIASNIFSFVTNEGDANPTALRNGGNITLQSGSNGSVNLSSSLNSGNQSNVNSGDINILGNLIVGSNLDITATGNPSNSAEISISGTINGASGSEGLQIDAGEGAVQIGNSIGTTIALENLTIAAQSVTISGDIRVANRIVFETTETFLNSLPGSTLLNRSIVANDFNFSGTLQGSNTLTIQPSTLNRGITLGNNVNNTLNLSPAEVAALQGFSDVTIGGGSGNITVNAPVTFNAPTQLNTTGNINVSGNVTTVGQDLSFGSNVNLGQNVTLSTGPGAGNLNFLGIITGSPYQLTLDAGTGNILLPRQVNVREFNVDSAQTLFLGEGITTANTPLAFNVPVVVTQNSALRTGTPGANITFNNTLNSEVGERNNLTLAVGSGNIAINGAVGTGPNQQLGDITLESVNNLTTNAPIQAGSLQQTGTPATGNIALNGSLTTTNGGVNLTTTGNITAPGAITTTGGGVDLRGNTVTTNTLTSNGGGINVTGTGAVSVTSATSNGGDLTLTGNTVEAETLTTSNGNLNVTGTETVSITTATSNNGDLTLTGRTVQTGTLRATGGDLNIGATGNLTTGNLTSTGDVALTTTTGNVTTGTITTTPTTGNPRPGITVSAGGNINSQTVTSGGGNIQLTSTRNGVVSTGNLASGGGNITLGNFVLRGNRLLASDGGNIDFLGTINGPHSLNLRAGATGDIQFTGLANVGRLNLLSAQTLFLGEGIATANTPLAFNVPVVVTQNSALRTGTPGANITFGNTLNSEVGERNNLTLAAGSGNIAINGAVGTGPNQQLGDITLESVNNLTTNAPIQAGSLQQTGTPATGNIALNGSLTTTNGGVNLTTTGNITAPGAITTTGGGVDLRGNTVTTNTLTSNGGGINVTGTGNVSVSNATANGGNLAINSGGTVQTGNLSVTGGNLNIGATGNLTTGNLTSTGDVALTTTTGNVTTGTITTPAAGDPRPGVTVNSGGNIDTQAITTGGGNIQLTSTRNGVVSTGNLTSNGGTMTLGNFLLRGDRLLASDGGNINFLGTINGPHALNLRAGATGNIQFTGLANVGSLNLLSAQTFLLGAGITTANTPLTFSVPVVLTQNSAIRTGTPGANITFANTLNSETGERNNLNLAAGSGNIAINGAVGNTQQLGAVTIESVSTLTTNAPIQVGSLQTSTPATGNIALNQPLTTTNGGVNLTTTGNITAPGTLTTTGGSIDLQGNTVTTNTLTSSGGGINVTGTGAVSVTSATSNGGDLTLTGNTVEAETLSATGGGIEVTAPGEIAVPTVTSDGNVTLTSTGGRIQTSTVTTNGGNVALNADTSLAVDNVITNGGNITLSSSNGPIMVNTLSSASDTAAGGAITITNPNAITATGPIDASGATTGGNITLRGGDTPTGTVPPFPPTGTVTTGNLTATGVAGGGNITVLARDSITAGEINTSATFGNGGNVFLDPDGDVQVTFINAQGGTAAGGTGIGGNVFIVSIDRFFRATGSFIDQNNINASISAAGRGGEGRITITHNGGAADVLVPFIISRLSDNGTVGALTTGANNTIFPGSFLGPYTQGRIDIITSPQATLAADAALPDTLPEEIRPENADDQPFWLDEYFTRRTEDYLGINGETRVKSLEEIQDELQRIEDLTGVKPALIYVVFEPEEVERVLEAGLIDPDGLVNQGSLMRFRELGSDRVQLVLVTAEGQPILRRPDDPAAMRANIPTEVENLRRRLLDDFEEYQNEGVTLEGRYLGLAQQLYQWLVAPLERDLQAQGIQNLVFVMDTGLRTTPMAVLPALHDGQDFLIRHYSVGLMPSFSLTDTRLTNIRDAQVLAMGMDDFSQHSNFGDLFAVPDEIRLITQELWPSIESDMAQLLGQAFTPDALVQRRRNRPAGIVHLATHTKFEAGSPEESFIIFADDKLFFNDFRRLEFGSPPVELLVLSSCTSALSADDDRAELGFAGLSVQAGVKSSLASLWEVSDFGTLGLMAEFYSQLRTAPIKAEALRRAQLAMIDGDVALDEDNLFWSSGMTRLSFNPRMPNTESSSRHLLSHPGYWAGFTIVGNPW